MLKLKDLLEVIEEGTKLMIIEWTGENHKVVYFQGYNLEQTLYDDYKIISMEQSLNYIIINIIKVGLV